MLLKSEFSDLSYSRAFQRMAGNSSARAVLFTVFSCLLAFLHHIWVPSISNTFVHGSLDSLIEKSHWLGSLKGVQNIFRKCLIGDIANTKVCFFLSLTLQSSSASFQGQFILVFHLRPSICTCFPPLSVSLYLFSTCVLCALPKALDLSCTKVQQLK